MPLTRLPSPRRPIAQLIGWLKGVPCVILLFVTLLAINGLQTLSTVLIPFSRQGFRKVNRSVANAWWSLCVLIPKHFYGVQVVLTGDPIPCNENALLVANHQSYTDITLLIFLAYSKRTVGDMKWFVKEIIKYFPGVGWGMVFLDCPFVKRNWSSDKDSIQQTFARLLRDQVPLWLISFVEGTRQTPKKLAASQAYARQQGMAPLEHVMIPRTKGFVASVQGMAGHIQAVYDITIGYEQGVPNLWQYCQGIFQVAHFHVRRTPVQDLPKTEEGLSQWLIASFREKDRLLDEFYRSGIFPKGSANGIL